MHFHQDPSNNKCLTREMIDKHLDDSNQEKNSSPLNSGRLAFEQVDGQFVCHSSIIIDDEDSSELLEDIADEVINSQHQKLFKPGTSHSGEFQLDEPEETFGQASATYSDDCHAFNMATPRWHKIPQPHISVLRGHRVVLYHQIRPLIDQLRETCARIHQFNIILSDIELFFNQESTKCFLSLARPAKCPSDSFERLRDTIKPVIEQYASRMTEEDDFQDTRPHCSFLYCDIIGREKLEETNQTNNEETVQELIKENNVLKNYLYGGVCNSDTVCIVRVKSIQIRIGSHVYSLPLHNPNRPRPR